MTLKLLSHKNLGTQNKATGQNTVGEDILHVCCAHIYIFCVSKSTSPDSS